MSDTSQGPGWWLASDGRWYPPEAVPGPLPQASETQSPLAPGGSVPAAIPASGPSVPPGVPEYGFQPGADIGAPPSDASVAGAPWGPPPGTPGYGAPPAANGYGPPPGSPEYGPPPGTNGYGPPQGANGYGPPPGTNGYGPPQGANGYGPPPGTNGYGPPQGANGYGPPPVVPGYSSMPAPEYGYGYQPGYPGYGFVPVAKTNGFAIASLVCSLLWIFGLTGVLAIVFGFVARSQIKQSGGGQRGNGLALAGIIIGFISVIATVLVFVAVAVIDHHCHQNGTCTFTTLNTGS